MRGFIFFGLCFIQFCCLAQQRPFVNSLSKTSGTVGEEIAISGSGFTSNCQVNFGAGIATYTLNSSTLITATVPSNATFGPVTVTDLSSGLGGSSINNFSISFGGQTLDVDNFDSRVDFSTANQFSYDLCVCDFDQDGLNDIAVSNEGSERINIYTNNSSGNNPSFINTAVINGSGFETTSTACGDLDNDGKPDLVFSVQNPTQPTHIFVYQNTSSGSPSFTLSDQFLLPNKLDGNVNNPRKMSIADFDGDGRKDLLVGTTEENKIFIYRSTSSGSINLASTPFEFIVEGILDCPHFDVGDLNLDGRIDIVILPFDRSNEQMAVIRNISGPDDFMFETDTLIGSPATRRNLVLSDLDNDGLLDVASTADNPDRIYHYLNNSTAGEKISFVSENFVSNVDGSWGIYAADIDGNGLTDLVSASVESAINVLVNESTVGNISFSTPESITTDAASRNIVVSDFNADAKPDIAFTHRSLTNTIGELSIITNRNCVIPSITPLDQTFCLNSPFTLQATKTQDATYLWAVTSGNGSAATSDEEGTITVTSGTQVTVSVTVSSNDGNCSETTSQTFDMTSGSTPTAPAISNSATGTICSGDSFSLTGPTADNYFWTLPDGSTTSDASITISDASAINSGLYELRVQSGTGCISNPSQISISVDEPPVIAIANNGTDNFCANSTTELQVPGYDGFSYQWSDESGPISAATTNSYEASVSGRYAVQITSDVSGCSSTSETYTVQAVSVPVSSFTSDTEICIDAALTMTATSTGADGFDLNYSWDFADGSNSTDQDPTKTWTAAGAYDVVLTTAYDDVDNCSNTSNQSITVSEIPTVDITIPGGTTEKCPSDSIRLELPQTYLSYIWSTGDTEFFTYAKTGSDSSEVTISVDMVTDIGCPVTSEQRITNFSSSGITFTSTEATITGDSVTLGDQQTSVQISAEVEGGSDYLWEPEALLDRTDEPTVTVFPTRQINDVTLTATDINGCRESAMIRVINQGVIARKTFSPNGDGLGFDCWEILNTENLNGCTVYVFDSRGRTVFSEDSPFVDNCVWNGNIDGSSTEAPEGVYYFVLKCDNSEFDRTGSILLGRGN